ncbi:MAG TPA: RNA methyltransferase [Flavobacteriales bacterium]|jgi:23S rRNA (guanosine2251-2'-O)-methyltransferase|nr:RNA methyltransferase [Flavobacteriales bacterium]
MNRKLKVEELNRLTIEEYKNSKKVSIVLVLDNIRSLHNVGSIFRNADAFRIQSIVLCGITATPPNREIQKTALGSTDSVEWRYLESTVLAVEELKSKGYRVFALEQTDNSSLLEEVRFKSTDKIAIVVGNEVYGVQQEVINTADGVLEIAQFGTKHSLNVSVSCGIVLWQLSRFMRKR